MVHAKVLCQLQGFCCCLLDHPVSGLLLSPPLFSRHLHHWTRMSLTASILKHTAYSDLWECVQGYRARIRWYLCLNANPAQESLFISSKGEKESNVKTGHGELGGIVDGETKPFCGEEEEDGERIQSSLWASPGSGFYLPQQQLTLQPLDSSLFSTRHHTSEPSALDD